jgi:hypothetical protein
MAATVGLGPLSSSSQKLSLILCSRVWLHWVRSPGAPGTDAGRAGQTPAVQARGQCLPDNTAGACGTSLQAVRRQTELAEVAEMRGVSEVHQAVRLAVRGGARAVNPAPAGLLDKLVDVKASAELALGASHDDRFYVRAGVRLPQPVEQAAQHCRATRQSAHKRITAPANRLSSDYFGTSRRLTAPKLGRLGTQGAERGSAGCAKLSAPASSACAWQLDAVRAPAGCSAFTGGFCRQTIATPSLPYSTVAVGPGILPYTATAS